MTDLTISDPAWQQNDDDREYAADYDDPESPMPDLTLTDLQATITDIAAAEMDPVERARQCTRIAYTAVAVAFTQGAITKEVATGLIDALDAVLAELEDV